MHTTNNLRINLSVGLFVLLVASLITGCGRAKEKPKVDKVFAKKLELMTVNYIDPRPLATEVKNHESELDLYNLYCGIPDKDSSTSNKTVEGALAQTFYNWEDWENAEYFSKRALAKKRDPRAIWTIVRLAAETENSELLKLLREDDMADQLYPALIKMAEKKYDEALAKLMKRIEDPKHYRLEGKGGLIEWSHFIFWMVKILDRQKRCDKITDLNDGLNIFMDVMLEKKYTLDSYSEMIGKGKITSDQRPIARDFIQVCMLANKVNQECGNNQEAEKWRSRGLQILKALMEVEPGNEWYKLIVLPKLAKNKSV